MFLFYLKENQLLYLFFCWYADHLSPKFCDDEYFQYKCRFLCCIWYFKSGQKWWRILISVSGTLIVLVTACVLDGTAWFIMNNYDKQTIMLICAGFTDRKAGPHLWCKLGLVSCFVQSITSYQCPTLHDPRILHSRNWSFFLHVNVFNFFSPLFAPVHLVNGLVAMYSYRLDEQRRQDVKD